MSKKFQPAKEMLISDLEVVKVMSDPLRIQIIEAMMSEPITVKQVAAIVDVPQSKLYYHVGLLEKHGLIAVVDTQIVSGIVEKWYHAAADSYRIDRQLFKTEGGGDSTYDLISTVFESTATDIRRAMEKGIIKLDEDSAQADRLMLGRTRTFLTPEQAAHIYAQFEGLVKEFASYGEGEQAEGTHAYSLMIALYPFDENTVVATQPEDQADDKQ